MSHIKGNLRKGRFDYRCTDNLLALRWRDKKDERVLSSVHEPKVIETGRRNYITGLPKLKSECVANYNIKMGSVNRVDMILNTLNSFSKFYSFRKCIKWYKKSFFFIY